MRLKTVSIQNFRLIADATIEIPTGLTLVNGENGLGKSSIFQAILWCLYGPDALGDNQTSLVRQGHRDMLVQVKANMEQLELVVTRKFSLAPNGNSGRTELDVVTFTSIIRNSKMEGDMFNDLSGGTVAEAQANINKLIGTRDIFMATAYVDQHDGPGAFLRSKPTEQREQLRDLLKISPDWDTWHDLAKLKHRTVADRIVGNLGRAGAAQEFIDQNGETNRAKEMRGIEVAHFSGFIKKLNLDLEDLQDAQDEVDRVVAENERRTKALDFNKEFLDHEGMRHLQALNKKTGLTTLVAHLPTLDEERRTWLTETDVWDDRNTEYQELVRKYVELNQTWVDRLKLLEDFSVYCESINIALDEYSSEALGIRQQISNFTAELDKCPTCKQELKTDEAQQHISDQRAALADDFYEVEAKIKAMPERIDWKFITDEQVAHYDTEPVEPVSPGMRPLFESEAEWNSAKSAESDIAAVDAEIKTRAEQVDTLSLAREQLPTPAEYDIAAYTARAQTIVKVNGEIEQAETDKRDRERKLAQAETTLEWIEKNKAEITQLEQLIEADQTLQKELDIVVTGTGPNGARQLMIDQQLGDFQAEVNQWLGILLPGFAIYMDTQAESGRESFTTAFATPTGVIGWNGLSGAQRVAVGLSTRLALASMVQQRQGHTFETWIIDEADGAMRGEKREAFVAMLYKLQQQGIDLLVVSHADTVVERMEQSIEVVDAGGYTEVK